MDRQKRVTVEMLVREAGFCCPFAFFINYRDLGTKKTAQLIGISPRTVRSYKQLIKERKLGCAGKPYCYFGTGSSNTSSNEREG